METSKCPKCGSPRNIHAGFEGARFYCGSAGKAGEEGLCWEGEECQRRQEVNGLRAELARLKSEKEAAEDFIDKAARIRERCREMNNSPSSREWAYSELLWLLDNHPPCEEIIAPLVEENASPVEMERAVKLIRRMQKDYQLLRVLHDASLEEKSALRAQLAAAEQARDEAVREVERLSKLLEKSNATKH